MINWKQENDYEVYNPGVGLYLRIAVGGNDSSQGYYTYYEWSVCCGNRAIVTGINYRSLDDAKKFGLKVFRNRLLEVTKEIDENI